MGVWVVEYNQEGIKYKNGMNVGSDNRKIINA